MGWPEKIGTAEGIVRRERDDPSRRPRRDGGRSRRNQTGRGEMGLVPRMSQAGDRPGKAGRKADPNRTVSLPPRCGMANEKGRRGGLPEKRAVPGASGQRGSRLWPAAGKPASSGADDGLPPRAVRFRRRKRRRNRGQLRLGREGAAGKMGHPGRVHFPALPFPVPSLSVAILAKLMPIGPSLRWRRSPARLRTGCGGWSAAPARPAWS